jgi:hypothetical protein
MSDGGQPDSQEIGDGVTRAEQAQARHAAPREGVEEVAPHKAQLVLQNVPGEAQRGHQARPQRGAGDHPLARLLYQRAHHGHAQPQQRRQRQTVAPAAVPVQEVNTQPVPPPVQSETKGPLKMSTRYSLVVGLHQGGSPVGPALPPRPRAPSRGNGTCPVLTTGPIRTATSFRRGSKRTMYCRQRSAPRRTVWSIMFWDWPVS